MHGFLPKQGSKAKGIGFERELSPTLRSGCDTYGITAGLTVRRLTPLECERLMGFPDNHTRIPWAGKPAEQCPDSHRYKACGNSMCVNVMLWIGRRIEMVEKLIKNIR
jgi:DNA (cytosine-5)-methyltransferase 1